MRSAIVQGALSQLGGEIIENAPRQKLLDKFNLVGGPKSARAVNKEIVGGEIVARSDSPSRFNRVTDDGTNLEVFTDANGNRVTRRVEECFVAGTLIATSEGLRAIEDLRVGDKVYSTNEKGIGGAFAVRTLFTRQVDCVYDIKVDGTTITSSGEHPFWVMGCGWKLARELEPGDFLVTRTGLNWPVDGVECRSGDFKVYNFEISEYHTYYVSELEIFVHNMCGDYGKINPNISGNSRRIIPGRTPGGEIIGDAIGVKKSDLLIPSKQRRIWELTDPSAFRYHRGRHADVKVGNINPEPKNPLDVLQNSSVWVDPNTTTRRVGVDSINNEFVIFDETFKGDRLFHGHSRAWNELSSKMKSQLIKAGLATRKGEIIP